MVRATCSRFASRPRAPATEFVSVADLAQTSVHADGQADGWYAPSHGHLCLASACCWKTSHGPKNTACVHARCCMHLFLLSSSSSPHLAHDAQEVVGRRRGCQAEGPGNVRIVYALDDLWCYCAAAITACLRPAFLSTPRRHRPRAPSVFFTFFHLEMFFLKLLVTSATHRFFVPIRVFVIL